MRKSAAKPTSTTGRLRSTLRLAAINVVVAFVLFEGSLRVQQIIGPLYNLDFHQDVLLAELSDELNHVHSPGGEWDQNGIRQMPEPNSPSCTPRILFMGDSYMEGLGADETIPYQARAALRRNWSKDVCVFNAGASSYSPSIYIPQAKKLVPLLHPDLVVIDVDETDIYDDWYRYRDLVVRDAAGSITAVRHSPYSDKVLRSLAETTDKPLYIQRLVARLYFSRVTFPRLQAEHFKDQPLNITVVPSMDESEARRFRADQIAYFAATLEDLTRSLIRLTGGEDRLVYIHHPQPQHLFAAPRRYNHIVAETIGEVAARYRVRYYDATADLAAQFGTAARDYYLPDNVHFNSAGARAYADEVVNFLVTTRVLSAATGESVHRIPLQSP